MTAACNTINVSYVNILDSYEMWEREREVLCHNYFILDYRRKYTHKYRYVSGLIASHSARYENKNPCEMSHIMSHHSYVHRYITICFLLLYFKSNCPPYVLCVCYDFSIMSTVNFLLFDNNNNWPAGWSTNLLCVCSHARETQTHRHYEVVQKCNPHL